jgi:TetR/AcrR family fatty acid metabolism transcriptional regulator
MRSADKHQKIIDAAVRVFAKKGFFNARISDIAKQAGVADGTIYLYFNNKYDILISLFEEEIGKLIAEVKERTAGEDDPRKMLEVFIAEHIGLVRRNRSLAEVLQMELRQSNKFMREYRNTRFIEYLDIISAIVKKGQQAGVFRPDIKPGIAKRAIFGAIDECARLWILNPDAPYDIDETAAHVSRIFLAGLEQPRQS